MNIKSTMAMMGLAALRQALARREPAMTFLPLARRILFRRNLHTLLRIASVRIRGVEHDFSRKEIVDAFRRIPMFGEDFVGVLADLEALHAQFRNFAVVTVWMIHQLDRAVVDLGRP